MATAVYRMYPFWRVQILAMFALFAVVAVVLLVVALSADAGPPVWFAVFWLFAVSWNAYWFLLRIAYRLELSGTDLTWRAPLRSGVLKLSDLVELRPQKFGSSIEVLQLADGSKVLVTVRKGFVDFMAELQAVAPHIQARVGTFAKIGERLPGPRGFHRS